MLHELSSADPVPPCVLPQGSLSLSDLLAPISSWNPCSHMCMLDVVVQVGRGDGLMGFFKSKGMSFAARTTAFFTPVHDVESHP